MSYIFYRYIHLIFLVLVLSGLTANYFLPKPNKWVRNFTIVSSLIFMISGFGLVAKLHLGWPLWVNLKLAVWAIIAIFSPVFISRLPQFKIHFYLFFIFMFLVAITLVVFRPM